MKVEQGEQQTGLLQSYLYCTQSLSGWHSILELLMRHVRNIKTNTITRIKLNFLAQILALWVKVSGWERTRKISFNNIITSLVHVPVFLSYSYVQYNL